MLKTVKVFSTKDPGIQRAVSALERATDDSVRELSDSRQAKLDPTETYTANVTVKPGQLVKCDPSGAPFRVYLPKPVKRDAGTITVVKNVTTSTNAITVFALDSTIDSNASYSLNSSRQSESFYCDGAEYWMV